MDDDEVIDRLRGICLALPETNERASHGSPSFFIRDRKQFVSVDLYHHGSEHVGFWCPAPAGVQQEMIDEDATRFFRPPYVGPKGWLGVRLAAAGLPGPDWVEVGQIVRDAYRCVAPKTLAKQLDASDPA